MAEKEYFAVSNFKTHEEEINFLQNLGFPVNPLSKKVKNLKEAWNIAEETVDNREKLSYQIDGLVVKLNDNKLTEKLGVVGKTPRGWSAIKFQAEEATTKIKSITWQVGRTGKLTPVAELEPVLLAGTTVKRATLHNFKEVQDMELQEGDYLIIRKAGDIIPEVVNVLKNLRTKEKPCFELPKTCPSCGSSLTTTTTKIDLVCPNQESCPAQVSGRLSYFAGRNIANINGLSEKNLQKFIEKLEVKDIPDLYNLPYEKIFEMEGFGQKSVENLKDSIEKAKEIQDYKFLAGLSVDGVGPEVAKLILEKLNSKFD